MGWFQRMMSDRYGTDEFSVFLLFASMAIALPASFMPHTVYLILEAISLILIGYGFFRIFSKNRTARYAENMKFLKLWNPVKNWFKTQVKRFRERKTHKYFRCPNCKKTLRVPKGIGKINITCPNCKEKFIRKA